MTPQTLLDWLVRRYPNAKRQTLKRMVADGRVRVNGRPAARLKHPLQDTDRVAVEPRSQSREANVPQISVVYEDKDVLVVHKPAGLLTSTVLRERRPTLLAQVREYLRAREPRARVGLIHRLDRDASGLLIFSKNDAAYRSLKTQFFKHTVLREYRAVVHGVPDPPAARIETFLSERTDGSVHSIRQSGKGQRAITEYETLNTRDGLSLLRVILHTGRKHQIRAHLCEKGMPIVGDKIYGKPNDAAPRLMLAATALTVMHPRSGKQIALLAPLPGQFPIRD